MATSTQQKQEQFKIIRAIANDLRGAVDGWDFKPSVLGMLFYRYISVNSYVEQEETKAETNIEELNARIEQIVAHENKLRAQINEIIKTL